jgi:hypothetical protein
VPEKATRESVYEETRKRSSKGFAPRSKEKISFLEGLTQEGKVGKIGKKYYLPEFAPDPEEIRRPIYREIQKAGQKGKKYTSKEKESICGELIRDGRIKKIGKKYYLSELIPDPDDIYRMVQKAGSEGIVFKGKIETSISGQLAKEGRIKKVGKKYYLSELIPDPRIVIQKIREAREDGVSLNPIESGILKTSEEKEKARKIGDRYYYEEFVPSGPLKQKEIIDQLLEDKKLIRSGKNFYIPAKAFPEPYVEVPSFLKFAREVQKVYLSIAGEYRKSVNIRSLISELAQGMTISEPQAEKWIVELPRIFLGRVDLRPFPGEDGLKLDDGSEVARIYLERGLVGL